jgi:hypothetical protein
MMRDLLLTVSMHAGAMVSAAFAACSPTALIGAAFSITAVGMAAVGILAAVGIGGRLQRRYYPT